jgi:predicted transcriptional regulator
MENICIRVPEEVKKYLEKLAEEDRRPLSSLTRNIILDWFEEQQKKAKKTPKK